MLGYALLGLIVGALLNHVATRLPRREPLGALPECPGCQRPHHPLEWVGIVALLTGRRRCPACGFVSSLRAPAVELFTALLFAYLWGRYGPSTQLALFSLYSIVFILVVVTDLEHRLILHAVMLPAIAFALVAAFFRDDTSYRLLWFGGLLGFLLVFAIYLAGPLFVRLWGRARGQTAAEVPFGFGDVTLSTFIGLAVGFPGIIFVLFIGFFLGGIAALAIIFSRLLLQRRYTALTVIPYGPFLVIGGMLILLYGPQIMGAYRSVYR